MILNRLQLGVVTASMLVGGVALGQQGYLSFTRGTDTINLDRSIPVGDTYTYEARIRFRGLPDPQVGNAIGYASFYHEQNGGDTDKGINFDLTTGVPQIQLGQCCGAPVHEANAPQLADGGWHHIATVRTSDQFRCYIDGQLVIAEASFGSPGPGGGNNHRSIGAFRYSYTDHNPTVQSPIMDLDWFRISSSARYDQAFTPICSDSISPDAATLALFVFNSAPSSGVIEASGSVGVLGTVAVGFVGATAPQFVSIVDDDCNADGISDFCQIQRGELDDDNGDGIPDVCQYTVTGVIPVSGASAGGTAITVKGSNFPENPTVLVGGSPATNVIRVSATRLTAVTPAGLPGMTSVTVGNWVQPNAFYYRPECGSDLDQDGEVTAADIAIVLLDFGPCYSKAANTQPDDSTPFLLQDQPAAAQPQQR